MTQSLPVAISSIVPPIPSHLPQPQFTDNAIEILIHRPYLQPNETPAEMLWRVAWHVAGAEEDKQAKWAETFYTGLLAGLRFLPNTPTLVHAGVPGHDRHCLSACFVLPIHDSLESIMQTLRDAAFVEKSGGGVGFSFSNLRPKDSPIGAMPKGAIGPLGVLAVYSKTFDLMTQGAIRHGAHMGMASVSHPDIMEFIHCKKEENIANFNLSVQVSDEFMYAVEHENNWQLIDPHTKAVVKMLPAKEIWKSICELAWATGDPGLAFMDRIRETEPNPMLGPIESSNPCLLGSTRMLTKHGLIPISELRYIQFATPNGWSFGSAWKSGHKKTQGVVLSNGQSITTTPDHKFVIGEELAPIATGFSIEPFMWDGEWTNGQEDFNAETMTKLGFLFGDGNRHESGAVYVNIGRNDKDIEPLFSQYKIHGNGGHSRYIPVGDSLIDEMSRLGMSLEPLPSRQTPTQLFTCSPGLVKAFLKGLFSANGCILAKHHRVQLKATNLQMVRDVQMLMLALGFRPYISINKPSLVRWHNGEFESRQSYNLQLSAQDLPKFTEEIGFIHSYKQDKLEQCLTTLPTQVHRHLPKVVAVEPAGEADVYDFNVVDESHLGWANGFMVSNCAEEFLEPYGSCNLGSIDLGKFVALGRIDYHALAYTVRLAVRFLDDVVTVNHMPDEVPQLRETNLLTRRIGLGVMGWADMLDQLQIPYDSEKATELAEGLSEFITRKAWGTSMDLAQEKGEFPLFSQSNLVKTIPIRNSSVTTIAPTGTISLLAGCSSGIEPHFALSWTRKALWNGTSNHTREITEKPRAAWEGTRVAGEIAPEWHVRHQAAWQSHVTNGVSKTINLPKTATVEDVSRAFKLAWKLKCKAITVYRDGSKGVQVLNQNHYCHECKSENVTRDGRCQTCQDCGHSSCEL